MIPKLPFNKRLVHEVSSVWRRSLGSLFSVEDVCDPTTLFNKSRASNTQCLFLGLKAFFEGEFKDAIRHIAV